MKAFAELVSGADAPLGNETAWSHLDPGTVESYRWDRWGAYPRYCPPEHREEAVARWQRKAKLAEMRREVAACPRPSGGPSTTSDKSVNLTDFKRSARSSRSPSKGWT